MKITGKIVVCLFLSLQFTYSYSQHAGIRALGVSAGFIHERSKQSVEMVASNVLRLVNHTSGSQEFIIQLSYPGDWSILGNEVRTYQINAGDSLFVPIRVIPSKQAFGNTSYVINAMIAIGDIPVANAIWNLAIEKKTEWHASLPTRRVYFASDADTSSFSLRLTNSGNSDEHIVINLSPGNDLDLTDAMGMPTALKSHSVMLSPGKDTLMKFFVRARAFDLLPTDDAFSNGDAELEYSVKLTAVSERAQAGGKRWTGAVDFVKLPDNLKLKPPSLNLLPLTIELNTYDIITDMTYATLDMYGTSMLGNQRTLNFYYQSSFVTNYMNSRSFLGQYHYIGYQSRTFGFDAGNIGASRSGINLSGKGVRGRISLFGNDLSAMYVRNPDYKERAVFDGYAFTHSLRRRKFAIENFYQKSRQFIQKSDGELFTSDISLRIARLHSLRLSGGGSREELMYNPASPKTLLGHRYAINYSGGFGKFRMGGNFSYNSPTYIAIRGMKRYSGQMSYYINPAYRVSASYNNFVYTPEIYVMGEPMAVQPYTKREIFTSSLAIMKGKSIFVISPGFQVYETRLMNIISRGSDFEYRYTTPRGIRVYSNVYAAYAKSPDFPELKDFFISQLRLSVRYRHFSANARYFYGPFYTQEQYQFLQTKVNPQKLYANIHNDFWFADNRALLKNNLNYNYSSVYKRSMLSLRPELFYYAPNNFRVSVYSRFLLLGDRDRAYLDDPLAGDNGMEYTTRLEFGIGIRKDFNIPMTFERFHNIEVITFRDLNANGVKDGNELPVGNMLIRLQPLTPDLLPGERLEHNESSYEVITNSSGKAVISRIPTGEYIVQAFPVTTTGGWFDGKTFTLIIDKNQKVYVPLNKGARLSGGIMVDRDKYTKIGLNLQLGNVRVTAVDTNGNTHSTLTNHDGTFSIFLPNGRYQVFINEAVFGEQFEFLQNNVSVTLNEDFENYSITFYLVERTREIRVRRFESNGNALDADRHPVRRQASEPVIPPAPVQEPEADIDSVSVAPPQLAPLSDEVFVEVEEIVESGTFWRIMLFEDAEARKTVNEMQEINAMTELVCVAAEDGKFRYYAGKFSRTRQADRMLSRILNLGFSQAVVVKFVDGNQVPF